MRFAVVNLPIRVLLALSMGVVLPDVSAYGQSTPDSKPLLEWHADSSVSSSGSQSSIHIDQTIRQAQHTQQIAESTAMEQMSAADPTSDDRKLAPPSGKRALETFGNQIESEKLSLGSQQMESLTTAGAGLAIVVGLFLVCMWLFRRSGPKATSPLPKDAVAVLGRLPLAGSHFIHLLRLGSKLVLVAVGPDSVTTLAEVSDPNEVQHLLGICLQNQSQSTTAEFQQVLEKLAQEPAQGFLEKNTAAAAYARAKKS